MLVGGDEERIVRNPYLGASRVRRGESCREQAVGFYHGGVAERVGACAVAVIQVRDKKRKRTHLVHGGNAVRVGEELLGVGDDAVAQAVIRDEVERLVPSFAGFLGRKRVVLQETQNAVVVFPFQGEGGLRALPEGVLLFGRVTQRRLGHGLAVPQLGAGGRGSLATDYKVGDGGSLRCAGAACRRTTRRRAACRRATRRRGTAYRNVVDEQRRVLVRPHPE